MHLTKGSHGPEVQDLQVKLNQLGFYHHKTDGFFGHWTKQAVLNFQERYLVDGLVDLVTMSTINKAVEAWESREVHTLLLPVPSGLGEIQATFGTIEYEDTSGGYIWMTNSWEAENIVHANLPIVGTHAVHKKMVPVFTAVLEEIKDRGLDREIETFWCWCPRHKMHDIRYRLSTHSWGIAVDINAASNQPGIRGDINPKIVEVFERHGFEWGGRWMKRDDMHLQFCSSY